MQTISDRITQVLKHNSLTQKQFANRIHVVQSHVSAMCSGAKLPTDRVIADICREFSVSEQWLRTGDGEMLANLTREQEIAAFLASLVHAPENSAVKSFILAVSKLSPREWEILFQIAKAWVEEMGK